MWYSQETLNNKEDPLVVVNVFEGDEGSGNYVYVIWKIDAFLRESICSCTYKLLHLTFQIVPESTHTTSDALHSRPRLR